MRFLDSCRFMLKSLETLAKNLTKDKLKAVKASFGKHYELMIIKIVYPYDYMDSSLKMKETQ